MYKTGWEVVQLFIIASSTWIRLGHCVFDKVTFLKSYRYSKPHIWQLNGKNTKNTWHCKIIEGWRVAEGITYIRYMRALACLVQYWQFIPFYRLGSHLQKNGNVEHMDWRVVNLWKNSRFILLHLTAKSVYYSHNHNNNSGIEPFICAHRLKGIPIGPWGVMYIMCHAAEFSAVAILAAAVPGDLVVDQCGRREYCSSNQRFAISW